MTIKKILLLITSILLLSLILGCGNESKTAYRQCTFDYKGQTFNALINDESNIALAIVNREVIGNSVRGYTGLKRANGQYLVIEYLVYNNSKNPISITSSAFSNVRIWDKNGSMYEPVSELMLTSEVADMMMSSARESADINPNQVGYLIAVFDVPDSIANDKIKFVIYDNFVNINRGHDPIIGCTI